VTPSEPDFAARKVLGFLQALGYGLELQAEILWGTRQVAGEDVTVAFHWLAGAEATQVRAAVSSLAKAGRSAPGAALYAIVEHPVSKDQVDRLTDIGVTVTNEVGYLNSALQSRRVCEDVIKEAERYIPEHEYVGQTFAPDSVSATDFLGRWVSEPDSGLLVVLAAGGYGKTCLANHLARELARKHLEDSKRPLPFLLPLHRHRYVRRFEELVLTHLQDSGILGFTSSAFAYLVNQHRIVLILDGFDELAETGGLRVARDTLRGLTSQLGSTAKALLTSRQAYFRHRGDLSLLGDEAVLDNAVTRELDPFDAERRSLFLQRRGLEKDQIKRIQEWINKTHSEELLGSPLILKILADETREGADVIASTAGEMLQRSLERVCQREVGKGAFAWEPAKQLQYLSEAADLMFEQNAYELQDYWLADILSEDVPAGLTASQRKDQLSARATQLKNHPLLIGLVAEGEDLVSFPHPLYRDFLLGRTVTRLLQTGGAYDRFLRLGLPEAACAFLADLMTQSGISELLRDATDKRLDVRDVWAIILKRCDVVSKSDVNDRTKVLLECLGAQRDFSHQNLARLRFYLLTFDQFAFLGANFVNSSFQSCEFTSCVFTGAQLAGTHFYECSADPATASQLSKLGIALGESHKGLLRPETVQVSNADPVVALVQRFFRRFIRVEPGKHQRTAKVESMVAGLGGEERKFTEREVVPEMKKRGIISELRAGVDVYEFNPDWQADGDELIWRGTQSERVAEIVKTLRGKARRYGLV